MKRKWVMKVYVKEKLIIGVFPNTSDTSCGSAHITDEQTTIIDA